jgi:DNA-binding HxlR family transcriptional regulator
MHTKLRQLEDLFAHRGDAHVMMTLRDAEPLRFSELARRLYERSTVRVADNAIARALQRLESDALVTCSNSEPRHPTYRLTTRGQEHAEVISALIDSLECYEQASAIKTM